VEATERTSEVAYKLVLCTKQIVYTFRKNRKREIENTQKLINNNGIYTFNLPRRRKETLLGERKMLE